MEKDMTACAMRHLISAPPMALRHATMSLATVH